MSESLLALEEHSAVNKVVVVIVHLACCERPSRMSYVCHQFSTVCLVGNLVMKWIIGKCITNILVCTLIEWLHYIFVALVIWIIFSCLCNNHLVFGLEIYWSIILDKQMYAYYHTIVYCWFVYLKVQVSLTLCELA